MEKQHLSRHFIVSGKHKKKDKYDGDRHFLPFLCFSFSFFITFVYPVTQWEGETACDGDTFMAFALSTTQITITCHIKLWGGAQPWSPLALSHRRRAWKAFVFYWFLVLFLRNLCLLILILFFYLFSFQIVWKWISLSWAGCVRCDRPDSVWRTTTGKLLVMIYLSLIGMFWLTPCITSVRMYVLCSKIFRRYSWIYPTAREIIKRLKVIFCQTH